MFRSILFFTFIGISLINCEEAVNIMEESTTILAEITTEANETVINDKLLLLNDENVEPQVILNSESGGNKPLKFHTKLHIHPIAAEFFKKISPEQFLRPVKEKLEFVKDYLTHLNHPNYGGVQFLNPQHIWEKFHEAGNHFLTGINGAVFGLNKFQNYDYPFPYRSLNIKDENKRANKN